MYQKIVIILSLCATPFVLGKLIDVHLPTRDDFQLEHMREKQRETQKAYETYRDESASEEDRAKAVETLVNNGVMA